MVNCSFVPFLTAQQVHIQRSLPARLQALERRPYALPFLLSLALVSRRQLLLTFRDKVLMKGRLVQVWRKSGCVREF